MSYKTPKKYFVTQHRGAIKWAAQSGVKARTIEMANFNVNEVVQGDVVIGTLPVHLAARAIQRGGRYWHLMMDTPAEFRNTDLTADQMRQFGARLHEFDVHGRGDRISGTLDIDDVAWADADRVLHICVATEQTMANLLPLLHLAWDRVVIVTSPQMERSAEHLSKIINSLATARGRDEQKPAMVKHLPATSSYADLKVAISAIAGEITAEFPQHRYLVNATGGLKTMTLAITEVFRSRARILYCDTEAGALEAISPLAQEHVPLPAELTDLSTLLFAQGFQVRSGVPASGQEGAEIRLKLTAQLSLGSSAIRLPGPKYLVSTLHRMASFALPAHAKGEVPARKYTPERWIEIANGALHQSAMRLLDSLIHAGVLLWWEICNGQFRIQFVSEEMARYLAGGYLEEFMLINLKSLGLPAKFFGANVQIDVLYPLPGRAAAFNEIDAALVWRNRLLVIECKAGLQIQETGKGQDILNKLAAIKRIAGPFGEAWMASKIKITPDKHADFIERAEVYKLKTVSGIDELADIQQRLLTWCGLDRPAEYIDWRALAQV